MTRTWTVYVGAAFSFLVGLGVGLLISERGSDAQPDVSEGWSVDEDDDERLDS